LFTKFGVGGFDLMFYNGTIVAFKKFYGLIRVVFIIGTYIRAVGSMQLLNQDGRDVTRGSSYCIQASFVLAIPLS